MTKNQKLVGGLILVSLIISYIIFWILWNVVFAGYGFGADIYSRLTLFAEVAAFALIPFFVLIAYVANKRFMSTAIDPLNVGSNVIVDLSSRFLQNTFEQTVLAVLTYSVLVILLPVAQLYIVPSLLVLFLLWRLTFVIGYSIKSIYRYFGFAMTFYPTIIALIYILYRIIVSYL